MKSRFDGINVSQSPLLLSLHCVRTQREGGPLQGRKRVLTRNQVIWHVDLGLPTCRAVGKSPSIVEAAQPMVFCYGTRADQLSLTPGRKRLATLEAESQTEGLGAKGVREYSIK